MKFIYFEKLEKKIWIILKKNMENMEKKNNMENMEENQILYKYANIV